MRPIERDTREQQFDGESIAELVRMTFEDFCEFKETLQSALPLSWRDTKAAVLVFNRNADFSPVLAKIRETVPKHSLFKRDRGTSGETVFRYVFAQPNDSNREIILTVLAFDIPTHTTETDTK